MLIEEDIFEEFYIVIVWWIKTTFMYVPGPLIKFIKLKEKPFCLSLQMLINITRYAWSIKQTGIQIGFIVNCSKVERLRDLKMLNRCFAVIWVGINIKNRHHGKYMYVKNVQLLFDWFILNLKVMHAFIWKILCKS